MTTQDILSCLQGVKGGHGQWTARCPAHDDRQNSLSVGEGEDGRILLRCHAGCDVDKIVTALGLSPSDLFPDKPGHAIGWNDALSTEKKGRAPVVATYRYLDDNGKLLAEKLRRADKSFTWRQPDARHGWVYSRKGVPNRLYVGGKLTGAVFVCEGEKDVDTLHRLGYNAASGADGAGPGKWRKEYTEQLQGCSVCVFTDNDEVGRAYAAETCNALHGAASSVRLLDIATVWPEVPEHGDVSDMVAALGDEQTRELIGQLIVAAPEWEPTVDDPEVDAAPTPYEPFEPPDTSKLPGFPVEQFPPVLRDFAQAVAENIQVAVDMPALQVLAAAAICLQGRFIINPKPGWIEPLNLYAVTVARPSDRKSPTVQACTRCLHEWEQEENDRRRPAVDEYNMKRTILIKRINSMIEHASKPVQTGKKPVSQNDIVTLQQELADLERGEVKYLRLLADDVTPEALVSLMAENGGKMAIVSDEGGIFDIAAGRYNDRANLDAFLKAYSGTPIKIDRKGRPPERIYHPALTMLLTVQPAVLEAIMGNAEFSGRGFLARFLYSLPASTVGHRDYETGDIPFHVQVDYIHLLNELLSIEDTGEARVIKLSHEASEESKRFFEALEPRLLNDLEEIEEWAGKYHGQIMRIAGIIHCVLYGRAAAEKAVSLDTIQRAEAIGEYFLEHALVAFRVMGMADRPEEKDAKYILKRLEVDGRTELSKRDLHQLCRGKIKWAEDMEPGLAELVKRGYVTIEAVKTGERGRPTEIVRVNPITQKPQNTQ